MKNFIDGNNTLDIITNSIKDLNLEQIGAIVHLSGSILILHCLMTIIATLFADKIIRYYGLEERFPKLAIFIRVRQKILYVNLFINFFIIILVLFVIIYLNLLVLFS